MIVRRRLRVVELYAGTGRSVEPFRRWQSCVISGLFDKNKYAADTYLANFPGAPYELRDLTRIKPSTIERVAHGAVDILLGCPPCQGFSDVGTRNPWDRRNSHLKNFARLAAQLQPLAIGMENVPLAASPRRFANFTSMIERAGYVWTAGILNAALRGSAQCRHRLVFIAIRKDLKISPTIPQTTHGGSPTRYYCYGTGTYRTINADRIGMLGEAPAARRVRDRLPFVERELGPADVPVIQEVFDDLPAIDTPAASRIQHLAWSHTDKIVRRMARVAEGGRWCGGRDHYAHTYGRLHRRGFARTITTFFPNPGGGRFWHPTQDRTLTLREAARLQGFPDSFRFTQGLPSYAAVLVGNALDAAIATTMYKAIRSYLS
jgi:DNA (cytosine-5)-methyltransferase 1